MKNHRSITWRWAAGISLAAGFLGLPIAASFATPTMDGVKDAEYTSVAIATADKLVNDPLAVPTPINDNLDPRAKTLVATGLSASNSGTDLYIYVDMPNLDLNVIEGEFGIVFHLGGANDAIQYLGFPKDPYSAMCNYLHSPGCNAVLKSNMAGFLHDYDGNSGYAFLNPVNTGSNGWDWESGNFLGNASWTNDTTNNLVHGVGTDGGEIVYKGGKGIEIKVPFRLFSVNPANTAVVAPKPGEPILMQFYDNMRDRTNPNYPRGSVYSLPFEAAAQGDSTLHDYSSGTISTWATSYTLKVPTALEVGGVTLKDPLDLGHIVVLYTAPVGDGAGTAANYTVVNETTGATLPVTSAVVQAADNTKVDLSIAVPYNTKLRVTVNNVKGANGVLITPTLNSAEVSIGTAVQFTMLDPYGIMAALGTNPDTSAPFRVSMTGDPIGWRNSRPPATIPDGKTFGWNEIPMDPVAGQANTYRSPVFIANAGAIGYKYCLPEKPDSGAYDGWNALNPDNRRNFVPVSSSVVQFTENAAGSYAGTFYDGGSVTMTFTLVDHDNLAAGRPVYVSGGFNGWSGDAGGAKPLTAVPGQPNTYTGTFTTDPGFGSDRFTEFKYILIYDDPANPGTSKTEWDLLNPQGNRWIKIHGAGTPLAQTVQTYLGSTKALRILRIASGLDMSPQFGNYYNELDLDKSGNITLLDAVKALHP